MANYPRHRLLSHLIGRLTFVLTGVLLFWGCTRPLEIHHRESSPDGAMRLTEDPGDEYAPAWSPDGKWIAYTVRTRRGDFDIARIRPGGGRAIKLTDNPTYDGLPAWSPDGRWIAFESDRDFQAAIWVMDRDGRQPRKLTRSANGHFTPVWSPDGRQILFESVPPGGDLSGSRELGLMDPWGREERRLAVGFNPEAQPLFFTTGHLHSGPPHGNAVVLSKPFEVFTCGLSWSPDGARIAYESVHDRFVSLWMINRDGTRPVRLTSDGANYWHPAWSPDGRWIAFASDRGGNYDLWLMDTVDGGLRQLTRHPASDFRPSWSPDGRSIVFTSLRSGNADLWVIRVRS